MFSFHRRAVSEFLVKREIPAGNIHHRLQRVCGDVCMGAGSVRRWVKMGTPASKSSLVGVALKQSQLNPTRREQMKLLRKTDA